MPNAVMRLQRTKPRGTRDLEAFVAPVVCRTEERVEGERDVEHDSDAVGMLPHQGGRRVNDDLGDDLRPPDPPEDPSHRTEKPDGQCQLVPPMVEDQHASAVLGLTELPLQAFGRHVPTASPRGRDLHVTPHGLPDLALGYQLFEQDQRWIAQVVLEHVEGRPAGSGRAEHGIGTAKVTGDRLLDLNMEPGAEDFGGDVGMKGRGDEDVDHVRIDRQGRREIVRGEIAGHRLSIAAALGGGDQSKADDGQGHADQLDS